MTQLPLPDAYRTAILNPHLCFSDLELCGGQASKHKSGLQSDLPLAWSGQFATVFRMQTAKGTRAVRCFTARITDHQVRYSRLHQHISGKSLPMLADFQYQPSGIRVNGVWYPIDVIRNNF